MVDNALWYGRIFDPKDEDSKAIAIFNEEVNTDTRVEKLFLTLCDGIYLLRKKNYLINCILETWCGHAAFVSSLLPYRRLDYPASASNLPSSGKPAGEQQHRVEFDRERGHYQKNS